MASAQRFIGRFTDFLSEYVDQPHLHTFLLAVSGGVDSMVLLHLFEKAGLRFEVAHCNYGLRGKESDADEALVKEVATRCGVTCHTKRFDTAAIAKALGISTQMAARDLRYDWFHSLLAETGCAFLATAHHRNDHAETVLFNLTKGTGIAGLHGIRPMTGSTVRPLLAFGRAEIESFAREEGIIWREDASNQSNKYSRNLIRNKVIPVLKAINPSLERAFWESSRRISRVEDWLADEIGQWRHRLVSQRADAVYIHIAALEGHPHRHLILGEIIRPYGFHYQEVDDLVDPHKAKVGRQFSSEKFHLVTDREQWVITEKEGAPVLPVIIEGEGSFAFQDTTYHVEVIRRSEWVMRRSNDMMQADADKIRWPIQIRTWQQGDTIQPLGMKGTKKISDIFIDQKVPLNLKSKHAVFTDQLGTIWIPSMKLSERIKVDDATATVLICTCSLGNHPSFR